MILPKSSPTSVDVAAHYDSLDRFYREIWGEHVHHGLWLTGRESVPEATRRLIGLVAEQAALGRGSQVCDVGCGYGGTARVLANESAAIVTGLTISENQYAYAQRLTSGADNPKYLLRNWADNGLPDESFDAVIAIESTEHMVDKPQFFAEARRVLRPGGRLVVCAWLARPSPSWAEIRFLLEPICRETRLPGMGSADEYRQMIVDAGLEPIAFQDLSRKVKKTWRLCIGGVLTGLLREREYRQFLMDHTNRDRDFLWTVFRMWLAYALKTLQYGMFTASKSPVADATRP
ncbi:MAG TPA: class I SAM-dependent methyltransferase [Pirellulales bacterium]|nr:class I SAM-dependent methyltransferase [Pirellulales bacterium]